MCPDRASLEKFRTQDELDRKDEINVITYQQLGSSENWDCVRVENTYNPKSYLENACVLRQAPAGSKPSQRKEFRAAEFKRITSKKLGN